jgi:hypothetical protein
MIWVRVMDKIGVKKWLYIHSVNDVHMHITVLGLLILLIVDVINGLTYERRLKSWRKIFLFKILDMIAFLDLG